VLSFEGRTGKSKGLGAGAGERSTCPDLPAARTAALPTRRKPGSVGALPHPLSWAKASAFERQLPNFVFTMGEAQVIHSVKTDTNHRFLYFLSQIGLVVVTNPTGAAILGSSTEDGKAGNKCCQTHKKG